MGILYVFIALIMLVLAILSRQHFSKYKGEGIVKQVTKSLGLSLYKIFFKFLPFEVVRKRIRNTKVLSEKKLDKAVEEYFVDIFSLVFTLFFSFYLLSMLVYVQESNTGIGIKEDISIKRQGYEGDTYNQDIILKKGEMEYKYQVEISPKEYSKKDFYEKTDAVFEWLETEILGKNKDLKHIRYDLNLVEKDKDGIFEILWRTDKADCISATGIIQEVESVSSVNLIAEIKYKDYIASHSYELFVERKSTSEQLLLEDALAVLKGIEAKTRENAVVEFPTSVDGVEVLIPKEKSNTGFALLILGLIVSSLVYFLKSSRLKEKENLRDKVLMTNYSKLVNHLWLFIGTGMTIKNSLLLFAEKENNKLNEKLDKKLDEILSEEIMYTIHLIDSGMDEISAYEDLGIRLGMTEYKRLFSHISQNLRMGTKDIRNIMEDELLQSVNVKREYSKKQGEEASTKLLIPMVVMLGVVMIIVMLPALVGYI